MKRWFVALLFLVSSGAALAQALTAYSSVDEANAKKIFAGFAADTGVKVDRVFLSTGPALSRIQAEASRPQADIWFGAPVENHVLAAERGLVDPYLFGFNGLISHSLLGLADFSIYGFRGVVLSQVFTFAPIACLSLRGVLQSISPTLEDACFNLRGNRWQTFRRITLPLSMPGIAGAFLIVFIESLADFGNPLVLGGAAFPMLATQA